MNRSAFVLLTPLLLAGVSISAAAESYVLPAGELREGHHPRRRRLVDLDDLDVVSIFLGVGHRANLSNGGAAAEFI